MDLESCLHQTLGLARPQEPEGKVSRSGAGVGTARRSDGGKGAFDTTGAEDRFFLIKRGNHAGFPMEMEFSRVSLLNCF